MTAKTLMIQGTGSHVGKSFTVAGLCRMFRDDGFRVAPFKAQNMALNSFATQDGLEIGRAQAVQAKAAGVTPSWKMNPILLKPSSVKTFQVIAKGKSIGNMTADEYYHKQQSMMNVVNAAIDDLLQEYDLIVIEGAGSPAEVNLRDRDIANMWVAEQVGAPVILTADIDKGGALAAIYGTLELLSARDRSFIKGILINKFQGDLDLLKPAIDFIEDKTGLPVLGVISKINATIEDEDSVSLDERPRQSKTNVNLIIPKLPFIANFTDFRGLEVLDEVALDFATKPGDLKNADAIIIPGSKNTIHDLTWLRKTGMANEIVRLAKSGTPVLGICGGLQILGERISDTAGAENTDNSEVDGLGLLPVVTDYGKEKVVRQVQSKVVDEADVFEGFVKDHVIHGYEIHAGVTTCLTKAKAFTRADDGRDNGWSSSAYKVSGTYMHGLFDNELFTSSFLNYLLKRKNEKAIDFETVNPDDQIDEIAQHLRASIDIEGLWQIINAGPINQNTQVIRG